MAVIAFSNVAVPIMSFNSSFNATHIMRQLMFPDVLSSRWVRSCSRTVCTVCFAHCFAEAHDTYTLYVLLTRALCSACAMRVPCVCRACAMRVSPCRPKIVDGVVVYDTEYSPGNPQWQRQAGNFNFSIPCSDTPKLQCPLGGRTFLAAGDTNYVDAVDSIDQVMTSKHGRRQDVFKLTFLVTDGKLPTDDRPGSALDQTGCLSKDSVNKTKEAACYRRALAQRLAAAKSWQDPEVCACVGHTSCANTWCCIVHMLARARVLAMH